MSALEAIRGEVVREIAGLLRVDEKDVSDGTYFSSDLGVTSLQALQLAERCEARFDVEIPDRVVPTLLTVGDLVRFILARREHS